MAGSCGISLWFLLIPVLAFFLYIFATGFLLDLRAVTEAFQTLSLFCSHQVWCERKTEEEEIVMRLALPSVPRDLLPSTWVCLLARIFTGIVFLWTGGVRLMDIGAFVKILSSCSLLPDAMIFPVAVGLPVMQLVAGVGLVLDLRGSVKASCGVLLTSLAVLAYGIFSNVNPDCSFFSAGPMIAQNGLPSALLRDVALLVVMLYLLLGERARRQTWQYE
jgi:uncharacterized membrane protein YphA (DoxX/SURF4 family)